MALPEDMRNGFVNFRTAGQGSLPTGSASTSETLGQRTLGEGREQASRNHDGSASTRFTGAQTLTAPRGMLHHQYVRGPRKGLFRHSADRNPPRTGKECGYEAGRYSTPTLEPEEQRERAVHHLRALARHIHKTSLARPEKLWAALQKPDRGHTDSPCWL